MSDDEVIRQRIAGKSVRAIAKAQRTAVTAVNEAVDRWAAISVNLNVRQ